MLEKEHKTCGYVGEDGHFGKEGYAQYSEDRGGEDEDALCFVAF